jgi:NADH-quinone oxidoreductase subunit L
MALAVGAIVVGFIGIPPVLGGTNTLHQFLAPSFVAPEVRPERDAGDVQVRLKRPDPTGVATAGHLSPGAERGLMFFSLVVAIAGVLTARHFYIVDPELPRRLASKWPGVHALLLHKYYVDELYDSTIVRGMITSARGLWSVDRRVVDGAVDGLAALTQIASWFSHMFDKHVVDGMVNLASWSAGQGSFGIRRVQTGLVQNYALLMVIGLFAFLTVYLLAR